jgi:hypothetical protein
LASGKIWFGRFEEKEMQEIVTTGNKFRNITQRITEANARFKKLSRAEQRVAIAKDVIAQLRAKRFIAESIYFQLGKGDDISIYVDDDAPAAACIMQTGCQVCGIGSIFTGAVLKDPKIKMSDVDSGDRDDQVQYLRRWFSERQLDLIENYFESNTGAALSIDFNYLDGDCEEEHGEYYEHRFKMHPIVKEYDNEARLTMIMQNIVSNDGVFDPRKGKHSDPHAVVY